MVQTIGVLIVEDDFRVAQINRKLIEEITGFHILAEMKTAEDTMAFLQQTEQLPELILLDVYIPDSPGLELFWRIRHDFPAIDIIFVTAAKETLTVEEALHGGVVDYLLKPVDFDRFHKTFTRYRARKILLSSKDEVNQEDLDRLLYGIDLSPSSTATSEGLPKGIDQLTLERIEEVLTSSSADGMNAIDVGQAAGVSRSTARRYLEYLVSADKAKAQLHYGDVGRPERTYLKI
ncbi:response regulator [Sporosarcina sp.]|uniref:response regulator n=1 Tax=Sporosarcina sp. TaxID=49982 RepID=UPI00263761F0|nr:response regulator [Sporosarcina sp.]